MKRVIHAAAIAMFCWAPLTGGDPVSLVATFWVCLTLLTISRTEAEIYMWEVVTEAYVLTERAGRLALKENTNG